MMEDEKEVHSFIVFACGVLLAIGFALGHWAFPPKVVTEYIDIPSARIVEITVLGEKKACDDAGGTFEIEDNTLYNFALPPIEKLKVQAMRKKSIPNYTITCHAPTPKTPEDIFHYEIK